MSPCRLASEAMSSPEKYTSSVMGTKGRGLSQSLQSSAPWCCTWRFFDTLRVDLGSHALTAYKAAIDAGYNLRQVSPGVLAIAVNEKTTRADIARLIKLITGVNADLDRLDEQICQTDPTRHVRRTPK